MCASPYNECKDSRCPEYDVRRTLVKEIRGESCLVSLTAQTAFSYDHVFQRETQVMPWAMIQRPVMRYSLIDGIRSRDRLLFGGGRVWGQMLGASTGGRSRNEAYNGLRQVMP